MENYYKDKKSLEMNTIECLCSICKQIKIARFNNPMTLDDIRKTYDLAHYDPNHKIARINVFCRECLAK